MFTLSKSIGIFVPSTEDYDRPISSSQLDKRVNSVAGYLSDLFGGYQAFYGGIGGYRLDNGILVTEDSILVVSFCTELAYQEHYRSILEYSSRLAREYQQETIGILDCFSQLHLIGQTEDINELVTSSQLALQTS